MTPRRLSVPTMLAFGVGEACEGFMRMGWGVLLLFYYQQLVGVEAAYVGTAIAIALVFDAADSPVARREEQEEATPSSTETVPGK